VRIWFTVIDENLPTLANTVITKMQAEECETKCGGVQFDFEV